MVGFVLSKAAIADLKSIGRYTYDNWGENQQNIYLGDIYKVFNNLTCLTIKGHSVYEIRKNYFKYKVGKHIVFYKEEQNIIYIIRVLHERMDVEKHLLNS